VPGSGTDIRIVHTFLALSLAAICGWLSVSAWQAMDGLAGDFASSVNMSSGSFNPYIDNRLVSQQQLSGQTRVLRQRLEFMVWPQERQQLSQNLVQLLQQKINLDPMNSSLWVQLSLAQADANIELAERISTIRRGLLLSRWSRDNRLILTRPCVLEYQELTKLEPDLCHELLNQIADGMPIDKKLRRRIAAAMGVKADVLKDVLTRHGSMTNAETMP